MTTARDQMIERLRATALATTQDAADASHDLDEEGYYRDDVPATRADAAPDYSAARQRMLDHYADVRDTPVETEEAP